MGYTAVVVNPIGQRLRALVGSLGHGAQARISRRTGIDPVSLSQKLGGDRLFNEAEVVAVCRALGLSLWQLEVATMDPKHLRMHERLQRILDSGDPLAVTSVEGLLTSIDDALEKSERDRRRKSGAHPLQDEADAPTET